MRMPERDAIATAIEWLECNEGGGDEATGCSEVAAWLRYELGERDLRDAARRAGLPVAVVRRRVADKLAEWQSFGAPLDSAAAALVARQAARK